ncbi:hypothetical protein [Luteibacter sp.]|jgi:hypothetical protein|uniref:hypothetical protein n=1 Tax=Luteibacter sp. TaxID=1886636 RepID=UPI002F429B64
MVSVHKLSTRDPLHDMQLLRDVALVNERVRRELGPPPSKYHKGTAQQKNMEKGGMILQQLTTVAATAILGTTSAWGASEVTAANAEVVPAAIAKYVDDDKALLAYKSAQNPRGGKTAAIILRHPKDPAPNRGMFYEDRVGYTCELILLREEEGKTRVTGRSQKAVDCGSNQINVSAEHLELNDQLELSPEKVAFVNEGTPLGSYATSFENTDGSWHLSRATLIYTDYDEASDENLVVNETASYPEDVGLIPMEKFDRKNVQAALSKNKTLVP